MLAGAVYSGKQKEHRLKLIYRTDNLEVGLQSNLFVLQPAAAGRTTLTAWEAGKIAGAIQKEINLSPELLGEIAAKHKRVNTRVHRAIVNLDADTFTGTRENDRIMEEVWAEKNYWTKAKRKRHWSY